MEKFLLEKGQVAVLNDQYLVFIGGEYDGTDLVPVYNPHDPSLAIAALQACYIATGKNYGEE